MTAMTAMTAFLELLWLVVITGNDCRGQSIWDSYDAHQTALMLQAIGTTLPGPTLRYFLGDVYRAGLECLGWVMGIQALAQKKAQEEAVRRAFRQERLLAVLSRSFLRTLKFRH